MHGDCSRPGCPGLEITGSISMIEPVGDQIRREEVIRESPLFLKTYDFILWLLEHTAKFPKSQRFVMAKRIEESALNFYDCLLRAVKVPAEKSQTLQTAGFELERLKHYLRLSKDMGMLSLKHYEYSSAAVVEIGRMLGGWIKKDRNAELV